jgi:hypothetical protein
MSDQSIKTKRKRLADTVVNIGCLYEEFNRYDMSNPYLSPMIKELLETIYTVPLYELDNAKYKIVEAISCLKRILKLLPYEKSRREKTSDIDQKEYLMANRKIAKPKRVSKSIRELPEMETMTNQLDNLLI